MTSEFYDEDEAVRELKERLRNIRTALYPLIKNESLEPALVPKEIREEIVTIFDEHGGIDLLSNLTKLRYNTINNWHRRWLYNPYVFKTASYYKVRKSGTLISKVLASEQSAPKLTKTPYVITPDSNVTKRIQNKITAQQEKMVSQIKNLLEVKMKQGLPMDEEVGALVKKLYDQIQDTREVAILLGINKKIVEDWTEDMLLD